MSEIERKSLAVYVGHVGELDGTLSTMARTRAWAIPGDRFPDLSRYAPGPEVLLAATSAIPGGTIYLIVGVLNAARLSDGRSRLDFESLERFVVPVVASTALGQPNRRLGFEKYWSPSEIYWLPENAAATCRGEVDRLTRLEES